MGKQNVRQKEKIGDSITPEVYDLGDKSLSRDELNTWRFLAALHDLSYIPDIQNLMKAPASFLFKLTDKLNELDRRTLTQSSTLEKLEADVDALKREEREKEVERGWPGYTIKEFKKIVENIQGLENAVNDKPQLLFHIMEIETFLGQVEEKARLTDRKYEARLAASLRDICRVHEPSDISEEQIKCFNNCITALIKGWGKLNREKVKWIRTRLLEVGLTWLPVTDKAIKDIEQVQNLRK